MPNQSDPNSNNQGLTNPPPAPPVQPTEPGSDPQQTAPPASEMPVFLDPSVEPPAEPVSAENTNRPSFLTVEETPQATPSPAIAADNFAPVAPPAETTNEPPSPPTSPSFVVAPTNSPKSGSGKGKKVAAVVGLVGLVAATIIGVAAVGSNRLQQSSAWDCEQYEFSVSKAGLVTVVNGSSRNEPIQKAQVKINNAIVQTFDVPALSPGQSATLGNVSIPGETFTWEVIGTVECQDGGSYQATTTPTPAATPIAQCGAIVAYNTNWEKLTSAQLTALKPGDKVRFAVEGITLSGTIDKARFNINGTQRPEVSTKKPNSNEFYDEYTIPAGVSTFNLGAQIHHQETNNWY